MDFDIPKVYGDTSITDGLVLTSKALSTILSDHRLYETVGCSETKEGDLLCNET